MMSELNIQQLQRDAVLLHNKPQGNLSREMYRTAHTIMTTSFTPANTGTYRDCSWITHKHKLRTGVYVRKICLYQIAKQLGFQTRVKSDEYYDILLKTRELNAFYDDQQKTVRVARRQLWNVEKQNT